MSRFSTVPSKKNVYSRDKTIGSGHTTAALWLYKQRFTLQLFTAFPQSNLLSANHLNYTFSQNHIFLKFTLEEDIKDVLNGYRCGASLNDRNGVLEIISIVES